MEGRILLSGPSTGPGVRGAGLGADLSIAITANPNPVYIGDDLTYTITVTNHGPDDATGVKVTDNLPGGVSFVSAEDNQGDAPFLSGNAVIALLGTIPASKSATVKIVITPAQPDPFGITDTVSVVSDQSDPNPADNTAQITTSVIEAADLGLTLAATPDPVAVGQALTYTATITNNSMVVATNVVLTDSLPAGVTFGSAGASQGQAPTLSGNQVTALLGTLMGHASATVTIVVTPDGDAVPSVTDLATVTSDQSRPDATDSSAQVTTGVKPVADLTITGTGAPSPLYVGQDLTYTFTVSNAGPNDATGVVVTDPLPSNATFRTASASQGTAPAVANGTLTVALGTIKAGGSATVTLVVTPNATAAGNDDTVTDTATVAADQLDPTPGDDSATVVATVLPVADLSLVMLASAASIDAGKDLVYSLLISNNGPDEADSVSIVDYLPKNVTFVSCDAPGGSKLQDDGSLTATVNSLAPNSTVMVKVVVRPTAAAALGGGTISNEALVSSAVFDPATGNNGASVTTTVAPCSALSVSIRGSASTIAVDQTITYTVTVSNAGPSDATNVVMTDLLDPTVACLSAKGSDGKVVMSGGRLTLSLDTLPAGGTATLIIVGRPSAVGTVQDSATATAAELDPADAEVSQTITTSVGPSADLALSIQASPQPVTAGKPLTYRVTVTNHGPSDATGIILEDTLPAGATFISASLPNSVALSQESGVVRATLLVLPKGAAQTLTIVVVPRAAGSFVDSAVVSSDAFDPVASNNQATLKATAVPPPGTLQFSTVAYSVWDNAGSMRVTVTRTDGTRGAVSIHYATAGGTARPGVDYRPVSGVLTFKDGVATQTFLIPVLHDPSDRQDHGVSLVLSNPTGGAVLGGRASATLTIRDANPDYTPPTISRLTLSGPGSTATAIVLWFSEDLNPGTATNLANYHVFDAGPSSLFAPGSSPPVALRSATYDPRLHTVTLTTSAPLWANEWYYLDVKGAVSDRAGNLLAGAGGAGTDYRGYFARGTSLRYLDAARNQVQIQVVRGGVIDMTRYPTGEGNSLDLVGIVPHQTVLYGSVRGGATTLNTMSGLGAFGDVRVQMGTPPFYVKNFPFGGGLQASVVGSAPPPRSPAAYLSRIHGPLIRVRPSLIRRG